MVEILATSSRFIAGQLSACKQPDQINRDSNAPHANGDNICSSFFAPFFPALIRNP
jgi:hypothetical protein